MLLGDTAKVLRETGEWRQLLREQQSLHGPYQILLEGSQTRGHMQGHRVQEG